MAEIRIEGKAVILKATEQNATLSSLVFELWDAMTSGRAALRK